MQKWRIVLASAITVCLIVAIIIGTQGITEAGMRMAIRATARTSCLFFLAAFVASALKQIWTSPVSTWLIQNRRFLGLSMAVSHTYHAGAIAGLHWVTNGRAPGAFDPLAILGYVFLYAMTITSFKPTAAWIGRRGWKILHSSGMYFFWLAFTLEFGMRMLKDWVYCVLAGLLIAAMLLRLFTLRKQSNRALAN